MKHFLVTRFNLKLEQWKTTKHGSPVLTDTWLKNRFELFDRYCLPSVRNQTNQKFIWFVFFDLDTPEKYREAIKNTSIEYPNFRAVFIGGMLELQGALIKNIRGSVEKSDEYIITSRLDNDDLIHKDFIKTIQKLFKPTDDTVIDLRTGYQIALGKPYSEIRRYKKHVNQYISLVERLDNMKTVISKNHGDWRSAASVVSVARERLWIELIHQENKLNSRKRHLIRTYSINNEDFGLNDETKFMEHSRIHVFIANIGVRLHNSLIICKTYIKEFLIIADAG